MFTKDIKAKNKLIFIVFAVSLLAVLAISCGDEKASTMPEGSPTPVVKDVSLVVHNRSSQNVDIKAPFALARVEGTMSSNLEINFGIRDPDNMMLSAYINKTEVSFTFLTPLDGTYQFYFDNSQQEESRKVDLSYTMYPR